MTLCCTYCGARLQNGERFTPLGYHVCMKCGSGTADGTLDFADYYRDYFPDSVRDDSPALVSRYERILEQLKRNAPGNRLLEIGCGNGQLLAIAAGRGWHACGTELSQTQVDHCRARGLDVRYGDLIDVDPFSNQLFDTAIMIEVLEHVPDPTSLLTALARKLAPGAPLYLTTPNFNSLSRVMLGSKWSVLHPEHVRLGTPRGVRSALDRAGYDVQTVHTRNLNIGEIRHGYRRTGESEPCNRLAMAVATRDRIDRSRILRTAKAAVNGGLRMTGRGDTLLAIAVRRA